MSRARRRFEREHQDTDWMAWVIVALLFAIALGGLLLPGVE